MRSEMFPSDPEAVIAWAARAYVVGLIRRQKMDEVIGFCLQCQCDGYQVGWPWGVPDTYRIQDAEDEQKRALHPVRRSWRAMIFALRAAV